MDEVLSSHVSSKLQLEAWARAPTRLCRKRRAGMNRYVLFPFKGGALALVVTFTMGFVLALHAGFAGLPLGIALLSWFFKYCFILLDAIVTGADEPPVLSVEMVNPLNEQRPLAQAVLIAGGVILTLELQRRAGPVAGWTCGALLLLLLPASIASLGMTRSAWRAAWPPELWSVAWGVGRDYLVLLGAIPGLALLFMALARYGASSLMLIAGGQLAFLLAFALIGGVLHEHRLELGIEYQTLRERIAERTVREHASERQRMMDHAYMKFRVGKPVEGWQEIHTWLQSQRFGEDPAGNQLREYEALLAIAAGWDDPRAGDRLTSDLVELYFVRRETGRALAVVEQRLVTNPRYRPTNAAHTLRLAELATAAGKRALRRQLAPDRDMG
jgi:hypothetical protein